MKEIFYYYDYELFYVNTNVKKHIKYLGKAMVKMV